MDGAAEAAVDEPHPGLRVLAAQLPDPAQLAGRPTPLVGRDAEATRGEDPAMLRGKLAAALEVAGHSFELPFVVLCRELMTASWRLRSPRTAFLRSTPAGRLGRRPLHADG